MSGPDLLMGGTSCEEMGSPAPPKRMKTWQGDVNLLAGLLSMSTGDQEEHGVPIYDYPLKFSSHVSKTCKSLLVTHQELINGINVIGG
eukprot:9598753-Lingulodinium_polyedra.AAC.1